MFTSNWMKILMVGCALIFALAACSPSGEELPDSAADETAKEPVSPETGTNPQSSRNYDELEIVTLLPRDGIPAIDNPQFLSAEEADSEYGPDELVIGVNYDGDARAYSIPLLSSHEIVNDTVGGRKIAVTW
jgi:hypothetical protein